MTENMQLFEDISLFIGIGALVLGMAWIVWDLARRSNAGRFGTIMLFTALGLGVLGFLIKTVLVEMINI